MTEIFDVGNIISFLSSLDGVSKWQEVLSNEEEEEKQEEEVQSAKNWAVVIIQVFTFSMKYFNYTKPLK